MTSTQLPFPLPRNATFDVADFMVSDCNDQAFATIHRWPDWKGRSLMLSGPVASGKTHLAHIWASRSHAQFVDADQLTTAWVERHVAQGDAAKNWIMEAIETTPDQPALFHWLNAIREQEGYLLLTSRLPAAQLPFDLPDLTSRLKALPSASLSAPDDAVLTAVLIKQFADRQLRVPEEVIRYLLPRMERSYQAASHWVEQLDQAAMLQQRKISIPLVRKLLDAHAKGDPLPF